jgi:hypothetical protein
MECPSADYRGVSYACGRSRPPVPQSNSRPVWLEQLASADGSNRCDYGAPVQTRSNANHARTWKAAREAIGLPRPVPQGV